MKTTEESKHDQESMDRSYDVIRILPDMNMHYQCDCCERKTSSNQDQEICNMPQPDGNICKGKIIKISCV